MNIAIGILREIIATLIAPKISADKIKEIEFYSLRFQIKSVLFANFFGYIILGIFFPYTIYCFYNYEYAYLNQPTFLISFLFGTLVFIFTSYKLNQLLQLDFINKKKQVKLYIWISLFTLIFFNYVFAYILNLNNNNYYVLLFSLAYINISVVLSIKERLIYTSTNYLVLLVIYLISHPNFNFPDYVQLSILLKIHIFFFVLGQVFFNQWKETINKHLQLKDNFEEINEQKMLIENILGQQQLSIKKLYDSLNIEADFKEIQSNPLLLSSRINNLILELNSVKEKLKESKEKYKDIFENVSDGILIRDNNWNIILANKKSNEITGFDLINREIGDLKTLITQEFREDYDKYIEKLQNLEEAYFEGEITTNRNFSNVYVELYSTPIVQNNKLIGTRDIIRNITEKQKKLQESYKKYEAERLFMLNLNHELRTPLNSIVGLILLLKETELNSEQKEILDVVSHSSEYLKNLISDILDLTKIESGTIDYHPEIFNFYEQNKNIVQNFQLQAQEKNLELKLICPKYYHSDFKFDITLYTKIINNLLSNALKFTNEGYIFVEIENPNDGNNKEQKVQIKVKDTGIGIPIEQHQLVFEKFKQLGDRNNFSLSGIGLGLSLCKEIIECLKGEIYIDKNYTQGTCFVVEFPITKMNLKIKTDETI